MFEAGYCFKRLTTDLDFLVDPIGDIVFVSLSIISILNSIYVFFRCSIRLANSCSFPSSPVSSAKCKLEVAQPPMVIFHDFLRLVS